MFKRLYFFVSDFLVTLAIAGVIFVFVYFTLLRPYQVNGRSMVPTFHDGQYVLTDVLTRHFVQFERGDIIVFNSPDDEDKDFIKRIIGVAGDRISVQDGEVYVNENLLDESEYLPPDFFTSESDFLAEGEDAIVPDGAYFVMGDNRGFSKDSRTFGFIPHKSIIGRSLLVYWPISELKVVEHARY